MPFHKISIRVDLTSAPKNKVCGPVEIYCKQSLRHIAGIVWARYPKHTPSGTPFQWTLLRLRGHFSRLSAQASGSTKSRLFVDNLLLSDVHSSVGILRLRGIRCCTGLVESKSGLCDWQREGCVRYRTVPDPFTEGVLVYRGEPFAIQSEAVERFV